jgi:hypothetical protein
MPDISVIQQLISPPLELTVGCRLYSDHPTDTDVDFINTGYFDPCDLFGFLYEVHNIQPHMSVELRYENYYPDDLAHFTAYNGTALTGTFIPYQQEIVHTSRGAFTWRDSLTGSVGLWVRPGLQLRLWGLVLGSCAGFGAQYGWTQVT